MFTDGDRSYERHIPSHRRREYHSVLAAHRGLPAARLFTDIDQLKQGDMFYIHVLDETMAYQVDQILDM